MFADYMLLGKPLDQSKSVTSGKRFINEKILVDEYEKGYLKRKEMSLTQKELADMLNITDKAVSKWERDISYPDTHTLPKLAEILGMSVEELMNLKLNPETAHRGAKYLTDIVLRAIPVAMGIAVVTTSLLGKLSQTSGFTLLGICVASVVVYLLKNKY